MIRINLLPDAKRSSGGGGSAQVWGVVYVLACFAWGLALFLLYLNEVNALEEQQAKNAEVQAQIDRVKAQSKNLDEVDAKLAKSKQLEDVVTKLQAARQGPTRLLMELSRILSAGRGPTVDPDVLEKLRQENPLAGYNPGWDIRRLWLENFSENNQTCRVAGYGKTNEDVAEFTRRLELSELFEEVQLAATQAGVDKSTSLPIVSFSMTCKVRY